MALKIIDCTLRDGSNAIDFQFDEIITRIILQKLELGGIEWIDMGHGLGLGASKKSGRPASLTDEEYICLAKSCLKKSKFGFFYLKKYGEIKDIRNAAKHGIDFIRIGSNVNETEEIIPAVKEAMDAGLFVNVCLMKCYAVNTYQYLQVLEKLDRYRVDLVTLMDSAGTMLPEEVQERIGRGKLNIAAELGFHAHNNLQLAVANIVAAVQSGADEIDVSVGGLGRSSGNAPTEILAVLEKKYGWGEKLNFKVLSDLSDEYIYPLVKNRNRFSSQELTFGFAGFHSSFLPLVMNVMNKKQRELDYRDVIIAVSEQEKIHLTEELIESVVDNLR